MIRWTSTCAWYAVVGLLRTVFCYVMAVTTAITSSVSFLPCTTFPKVTGDVPSALLRWATRPLNRWSWKLPDKLNWGNVCNCLLYISEYNKSTYVLIVKLNVFGHRNMANLLLLLALSKPAGATPSKRLETWPIPLSLTTSTCQFMWVCIMSTHRQVDPIPLSQPNVLCFITTLHIIHNFKCVIFVIVFLFVVKSLRIIKIWMKFIVLFFWNKLLKKLQLWVTKHCVELPHCEFQKKFSLSYQKSPTITSCWCTLVT